MHSSCKNNYRVSDKYFHKSSNSYHNIQPTPRLDSINGFSSLSDNFPGSSMSVGDIFLTMSNDGGQTGQTFLAGQIEDLPVRTHTSVSPQVPQLNQKAWHQITHCTKATCVNKTCAWHWCILNNPQFVRWQAMPVTVNLKRSSKQSFGFFTKAKDYSSKDKNEIETYTIVTQVEPNSLAEQAGLAVGDFVRSANHVALDTRQQYREFKATLKDLENIKMQIQRPEDISPKGVAKLDEFMAGQTQSINRPKQVTPSTSPEDVFLPVSHSSEAIPLQTFIKSKTQAPLPHARLIVCGNRTNEFMQSFMGSSVQFPANVHASYHHVSMETYMDGSVGVSNSKSFSCMCGETCQDSINVDIISVVNDNFFHHCCPWIFTVDCVFVLTFDVNRLAQFSDIEMARLTSLKHTVQTSCSGSTRQIKVVGITLPGEGLPFEEIRTLFYTSLGESLPEPNFVPISTTRTPEMQEFQVELFKVLKEITMQKLVYLPTLNVVDCLISHQNLTINNEELASTLMVWNMGSDTDFINLLVEDLKKTGNLISLTNSEYIIPSKLFDYLVHITMTTDRIHSSTGIIPRAHILEYLNTFTSDPVKSLACFEYLRIMFSMNISGHDSGFYEDTGILFPFVLEDLTFEFQTDPYQELFSIYLAESLGSAVYYSWLSKLSHVSSCHLVEMTGQRAGRFIMEGLDVICSWNKSCNTIDVHSKRTLSLSSRNSHIIQLQRIEKILSSISQMLLCDFCINWKGNLASDTFHVSDGFLQSSLTGRCQYLPGVNILSKEERIVHQLIDITEEEEKEEFEWLLDCAINSIPHLTDPLQEMYKHLSVNNLWEQLASNLGQTTSQVNVYGSLFVANPSRLPAETFYLHFVNQTMCTLRDIVSGLILMADDNPYSKCMKIAESLLTTAWTKYKQNKDKLFCGQRPF